MSEDQNRGRRRPSRERRTPPTESTSLRRQREEQLILEEEPLVKHIKKETDPLPESEPQASTSRAALMSLVEPKTEPEFESTASERQSQAERYEILQTRPTHIQTKKGTSGKRVTLQTNYYRLLTKPTWQLFQYVVSFNPEIGSRRLRCGLLSQHRAAIGGYLYDGTRLFTTTKFESDQTMLNVTSRDDTKYELSIKYIGILAMTEWQSVQVLNLVLRRAMEGLKLQLVGRNYFDPFARINIHDFRLQLWPGYVTSIRQHEKDILLCADLVHKVMHTETVYDVLIRCRDRARDYQEEFRRQILGCIVLTDYNNKTYRINDVDFAHSPTQSFQFKGNDISFVDYYQQRYNIRIRDFKQPLLISKARDTAVGVQNNDIIILIPELCRTTGITESLRNNFQLMSTMADQTRMIPDRRIERLQSFNRRLQSIPESVKVLEDWHLTLDKKLVVVDGRELEPQRIVFREHSRASAGENADWTTQFRHHGMYTTPSRGLERWSVIATNRNMRELRNFVDVLIRSASSMKMRISRPREFMIYDDRNHSYVQAMEECCRMDPQLILCLVPNTNVERYSSIKKKSCLERAIPTQVITVKSATKKSLMSIATKVAIQMNCKLGYTPWMIDIPLSGLMTIGFDIVKCPRNRSKAFGALVATMDLKCNSTFYSTVAECNGQDALGKSLWTMMAKALRQYKREHDNKLPNRIIFYRDGVGQGLLKHVYEHEVKDIVEKLEIEYKRANVDQQPMIAYIVVSKSINTRLFLSGGNPKAGTVVDDVITLPERYDFYLVSQCVRQGAVSPTSYNVIFSTIKLTPDQLQLITFKMTHLYYNWSGTTRVPAVCQYAKKLATLVATNLSQPPQSALEKKLFYL